MGKELEVVQDASLLEKTIARAKAEYHQAGLKFNGAPTLKQAGNLWNACLHHVEHVAHFRSWLLFAIGDLLNHGEATLGDQIYQVVDPQDFSDGQMADAKWVAKAIPLSMRKPPHLLSWAKHRECAAVKDADERRKLIGDAARENLSYDDIRERRKALSKRKPKPKPEVELEIRDSGLDAQVLDGKVLVATFYRGVGKLDRMTCARRFVESVQPKGEKDG